MTARSVFSYTVSIGDRFFALPGSRDRDFESKKGRGSRSRLIVIA
jgi:hypothetical protein